MLRIFTTCSHLVGGCTTCQANFHFLRWLGGDVGLGVAVMRIRSHSVWADQACANSNDAFYRGETFAPKCGNHFSSLTPETAFAEAIAPTADVIDRWLDDLRELERTVLRRRCELDNLQTARQRFHAGIALIPIHIINNNLETVQKALSRATFLYWQRAELLLAMGLHFPVLPDLCPAGLGGKAGHAACV